MAVDGWDSWWWEMGVNRSHFFLRVVLSFSWGNRIGGCLGGIAQRGCSRRCCLDAMS